MGNVNKSKMRKQNSNQRCAAVINITSYVTPLFDWRISSYIYMANQKNGKL